MKTRCLLAALASVATLAVSTAAFAADEYNVVNGLTVSGNPLGLHGVDPVSMFKSDAPALGDAVHSAAHDGVDYYFASAETLQTFQSDPAAYLPQFGGFCAFGVYKGKKFDGDVRYADIVDGKLYIFVNAAVFDAYRENPEEVIAIARQTWPGIKATPVEDL